MNKQTTAMILFAALSTGCATTDKGHNPAIDKNNMNLAIKPGDDFFRYANEKWLESHPIPDEYTVYGAFTELSEKNEIQLKEIIQEASDNTNAAMGSPAQKIRDFYNSGMDTISINAKGISEIEPLLQEISSITDKRQLSSLIASMHQQGVGAFFNAFATSDPKQADMVIMALYQGGLSLPDRDDYFGDEDNKKELRTKYTEHITNMLSLIGIDREVASKKAENIVALETKLAQHSLTRVERRDPDKTYNRMTLAQLQERCPAIEWNTYFQTLGAPTFDSLNVGMPLFMEGLSQNIIDTDLTTLIDYLQWKVIHSSASFLGENFENEHFDFYGRYLYGQVAMQPRWKRVLNCTSDCLGEAIGQLYVEKHFPPAAKERMLVLVNNLKSALGNRIEDLEWMESETKAKALHKLEKMNVKVGYPDKWIDYSDYEVVPDSYLANVRNAYRFEHQREMNKIGKPVDKEEWYMTPQTVNAYYSPSTNEIVFPAGILQPPFFNMEADDAVNYGGIGMVIGHEMTHGFDDQGRKYDADGNLNDWWTEKDAQQFEERTQQMVKLFDEFHVSGYHINGKLTLGENIADLGGLNIAWDAFQMTQQAQEDIAIDGFSPAQRFFISYATVWRSNIREKALERRIKEDVHSPAEARVNRALFSMPHFITTFDIKADDKLFIAEDQRAKIW